MYVEFKEEDGASTDPTSILPVQPTIVFAEQFSVLPCIKKTDRPRVITKDGHATHILSAVPDDALLCVLSFLDQKSFLNTAMADKSLFVVIHSPFTSEHWRRIAMEDIQVHMVKRVEIRQSNTPREDYITYKNLQRLALQQQSDEHDRRRDTKISLRRGLQSRLKFHYLQESVYLVSIPLLLFIFSIILMAGGSPVAVFIPLWLLVLSSAWAFLSMWQYRKMSSSSSEVEGSAGLTETCFSLCTTTTRLVVGGTCGLLGVIFLILLQIKALGGAPGMRYMVIFSPLWSAFVLFFIPILLDLPGFKSKALYSLCFLFGPLLTFSVLLAFKLDSDPAVSLRLVQVMVPLFITESCVILVLGRVSLRDGLGLRCSTNPIRCYRYRVREIRLLFTLLALILVLIGLIISEVFLVLREEESSMMTKSSTNDTTTITTIYTHTNFWCSQRVFAPLMVAMLLLLSTTLAMAYSSYMQRRQTFLRQLRMLKISNRGT